MTTPSTEEAAAATGGGDDKAAAAPDEKADEKKPQPQPPKVKKKVLEVPGDVTTAYLVVRAALSGVLGINSNATACKILQLQKTYMKQPGTAKFGMSLGKRCGENACLVPLPATATAASDESDDSDDDDIEFFWSSLERACAAVIEQNMPISIYHLSPDNDKDLLGNDGNVPKPPKNKKKKGKGAEEVATTGPPPTIPVAYLKDQQLLVVCPEGGGRPFKSTGGLSGYTIKFDRSQSTISAGKKARECKLVVAFQIVCSNSDGSNADSASDQSQKVAEPWNAAGSDVVEVSTVLPAEVRELTSQQAIRFPQGYAMLERQKQKQQKEAAEAEAEAAAAAAAAAQAAAQTPPAPPTQQQEASSSAAAAAAVVVEQDNEQEEQENEHDEMVVNIEKVEGKIDYDKLVEQFGSTRITPDLLTKLQSKSKVPLHRFLRRNIFFSHRDLDALLHALDDTDSDKSQKQKNKSKKKLYLYTGRGPSSASMHLGHLIPFLFTKWLQEAFECPLVIQMTDDEKFLFKGEYDFDKYGGDNLTSYAQLTIENAKDVIACGFDYDKTFLFSDLDYVGRMYPNIVRIWKAVTTNTVNGIFGFDGSSNIGKIAFPAVQAAPSFASSFPTVLDCGTIQDSQGKSNDWLCLIPCAIDQDPYFRMTRDISHKLVPNAKTHGLQGKPALIHSKFFPPLQGATGKMSSSDENSAIFLTDTPKDIERKIRSHAFSGGQDTGEKQKELGADLDTDVSYQWLSFFLEDDVELERIGKEYGSGQGDEYWSTGQVKNRLIQVLQQLVGDHQRRRAQLTDDDVRKWMEERCIV